jgi:hypothetical protein
MREVWPLCGNESDRFPMLLSAYLLKQDQLSKSFSGHPWKINVVEVDNAPLVEAISENPDSENRTHHLDSQSGLCSNQSCNFKEDYGIGAAIVLLRVIEARGIDQKKHLPVEIDVDNSRLLCACLHQASTSSTFLAPELT